MRLYRLSGPPQELAGLDEVKAYLRVDGPDDDLAISTLMSSAREVVEIKSRFLLTQQTWRCALDAWPQSVLLNGWMALPLAPVQAVLAIRVYDRNGEQQSLDAATWRLTDDVFDRQCLFFSPPPHPTQQKSGIEIDLDCGFRTGDDRPLIFKQVMLDYIAHRFEHRGDGGLQAEAERALERALSGIRRMRLT